MTLRPLILGPTEEARAAEIIAHADQHHYIPGAGAPPPGDDPAFVIELMGGYKAVFSFTEADNGLYRHLSVSVPGTSLPNPIAVYAIAEMFGFTGWDGKSQDIPKNWAVGMEEHGVRAIIVAQRVERVVN
ncbi:MAG TPA: hypothetical protein VGN16_09285 [Acidobacteriaceae bacterium]|jgi:hypothetical protein